MKEKYKTRIIQFAEESLKKKINKEMDKLFDLPYEIYLQVNSLQKRYNL